MTGSESWQKEVGFVTKLLHIELISLDPMEIPCKFCVISLFEVCHELGVIGGCQKVMARDLEDKVILDIIDDFI